MLFEIILYIAVTKNNQNKVHIGHYWIGYTTFHKRHRDSNLVQDSIRENQADQPKCNGKTFLLLYNVLDRCRVIKLYFVVATRGETDQEQLETRSKVDEDRIHEYPLLFL